mgnify:CR=1 FL=1
MATDIKIICSMATRLLLAQLCERHEKASGLHLQLEAVGGVDAAKRVQAGEAFDCVILASNVIDQLIAEGKMLAGSRVDLVHSGVSVVVRAGAPTPDISTEAALKNAVTAAKSIGGSTMARCTEAPRCIARCESVESSRLARITPTVTTITV